jgi:3-dehydroquinate synthase
VDVGGGPPRDDAGTPTAHEITLLGYRIHVAEGALDRLAAIADQATRAHRYAIVTDSNVGPFYASRVRDAFGAGRADLYEIPAGEAHKTRETWAAVTDRMLADGHGRDSTVIALGGGVVGDLAGFVAATYMRGIPCVQVPTTLLAMVDASVGGKTGVDTPAGKNLVGAFHQPAAVVADTSLLRTLPLQHLRAGFAEALKHGVIADAVHFDQVATLGADLQQPLDFAALARLVAHSVAIKASVVARDEREGGIRKTLNFGHTLGHAVEHESGYALLHGEAVAIGMALEAEAAERAGVAATGTADTIREALRALALPIVPPPSLTPERLLAATRSDKKARAGVVEYALPARIGAMAGAERGWGIPLPDAVVLAVLQATV